MDLEGYFSAQQPDDIPNDLPVYEAETVLKYCANQKCKAERPYRRAAWARGLGQHSVTTRSHISAMLYNCTYCGSDFWYWIEISEQFAEGEMWVRKVGQLPPYDFTIEKNLEKALGKDVVLYKRAQICVSQSFGLAACSYLRRLLENQITPLLRLVYEVRKQEGEDISDFSQLLDERVAEKKIRLANQVLPESLLVRGENPLELIYDPLSAGLHRQSEDECMEIAREASHVLRHIVTSINDEYQQRQSKMRYADMIRKMRGRGT